MNKYYVEEQTGETFRSRDDVLIANFNVNVNEVIKYVTNERCIKTYKLEFISEDKILHEEVNADDIDKFNYSRIDESLLLSPTESTAAKEIAYHIKSQASRARVREVLRFDKLGWHAVKGKHYYCAGDTLIFCEPLENYYISDKISNKYHMEIDDKMSEKAAYNYSFKLLNISPDTTSLIFIGGLMGVMRQIIVEADVKIPCVFYVLGPSQTRKTTTVKLGTTMYNRGKLNNDTSVSSMRVSSTNFKIEEVVEVLKDTTFILDDLYREDDTRLKREYESRVRNLIRNFADNAARNTARSAYSINSHVMITAEYLLKGITNIGRMMLIHIKEPINSERLAECQAEPLGLSTFYYYFIKWLSKNYDKIVEKLRAEYSAFRNGSFEHQNHFERLYEQLFLMCFVFETYLDYAKSIGVPLDKEALADNFRSYVKKALKHQSEIMRDMELCEKKDINFSSELLGMLNNGEIKIGEKGADCFKKGNLLYITNNHFGKCLHNKYGISFSAKKISSYFNSRYISEIYEDNTGKKYDGRRYLALNIKELISDANSSDMSSSLFF